MKTEETMQGSLVENYFQQPSCAPFCHGLLPVGSLTSIAVPSPDSLAASGCHSIGAGVYTEKAVYLFV